jgi:hypothetical protein
MQESGLAAATSHKVEAKAMIESGAVLALTCLLVFGPLAWRVVHDRRQARALALGADIRHVVDRALGGESLISVRVEPASVWRSGRVVLSMPADWRWLLQSTWAKVLARMPAGYELVVQQRPVLSARGIAWPEERHAAA